jgi:chromosomal replication initiation ATPase DnaA
MKKLQHITANVATRYGYSSEEIRGPRRFKMLVKARKEVYAKAYDAGYSLKEIGRYLGGRDHTTIMGGLK